MSNNSLTPEQWKHLTEYEKKQWNCLVFAIGEDSIRNDVKKLWVSLADERIKSLSQAKQIRELKEYQRELLTELNLVNKENAKFADTITALKDKGMNIVNEAIGEYKKYEATIEIIETAFIHHKNGDVDLDVDDLLTVINKLREEKKG